MIRSFIYDALILRLTSRWYAEVLQRVPEGVSLLDVGIGTAGALLSNAELVRQKKICITGIDIDAGYAETARYRIANSEIGNQVGVRLESVYDHQGGPYDAIYFSGSLMLLPDPAKALRLCRDLLSPDGRIYLTLTLEMQASPWMEVLKPRLKWLTSIDFGSVTYERTLRAQLAAAGLELEELSILGRKGVRSSCIVVARSAAATVGSACQRACSGAESQIA